MNFWKKKREKNLKLMFEQKLVYKKTDSNNFGHC